MASLFYPRAPGNRRLSHMRRGVLLAALSILALSSSLAVAPIAHAVFPGQNGRIAYVTTVGDHKVIETVDAQGGDRQPLIDLGSGRDAIDPAWSHDGLKIAFAGQESPGGPFVIYTANADGTGSPQQVTTEGWSGWVSDTDPAWIPTGRIIAFVRTFADDTSEIWLVDLVTGSTTGGSLYGLDAREPAWSPDAGRIAFTAREHTCVQPPCRWGIVIWDVARAEYTSLYDPYFGDYDWHHPDWSPDGTMIVARFGEDEAPRHVSGVRVFDVGSGHALDGPLTPCHIMTEPSFSPDGRWVLATATPIADPVTGELGEPNLCAIRTDNSETYLLDGAAPRSDASWGAVPGSEPPPPSEFPPPPPPDTSPPTIEFRPEPSPTEWMAPSWGGSVYVFATDDRPWPSIECTNNGSWLPLTTWITWRVGSSVKGVATLPEGRNDLECTARDTAGNSVTASGTYLVDLPPTIENVTVSPAVARVGDEVSVSAVVSDAGSGVQSVDFAVNGTTSGAVASGEMSPSGSTFTGSFVPATPDLFEVQVSARDGSGLITKSHVRFVCYDPSAGSTNGTGWIVPGGSTSNSSDSLPGIDGVQKASFAFTARYRTASSVTPSGSLSFSYGNHLKLQSKQLWWLAVADARTAYLGGVASIQGRNADFPFVAVVVDGASVGGRDRFELFVYRPGETIDSQTLYSASGDTGGQINIRT
jgi:Tol biopolymer transport system component